MKARDCDLRLVWSDAHQRRRNKLFDSACRPLIGALILGCPLPPRETINVARIARMALAHLCGRPSPSAERFAQAFRVLLGAKAYGTDADDSIAIRELAETFMVFSYAADDERATKVFRTTLRYLDGPLAEIDSGALSALTKRYAGGTVSLSGALAELLIATGALGTNPGASRASVQKRVDRVLADA